MGDEPERLDDTAVRERLARLDELLGQVEQIPGPSGELALEAVSALAAVYGEALARAVEHASGVPAVAEALAGDELLGHLLVLHGVHPDPLERRVARALEQLRPAVRRRGGDVELLGIDGSVATVRLTTGGCGSSAAGVAAGVEDAVREAVLAVAPELREVRRERTTHEAAFVPLDSLLQRPAASGVRS
jgi:Fe-S cluster biogenesis protein NfuA